MKIIAKDILELCKRKKRVEQVRNHPLLTQ